LQRNVVQENLAVRFISRAGCTETRVGRLRNRLSIRGRIKWFFLFKAPKPALGLIKAFLYSVTVAPFPGVKQSQRDVDHTLPSGTEVNNAWQARTRNSLLGGGVAQREAICNLYLIFEKDGTKIMS
jgi:hypothetical protein